MNETINRRSSRCICNAIDRYFFWKKISLEDRYVVTKQRVDFCESVFVRVVQRISIIPERSRIDSSRSRIIFSSSFGTNIFRTCVGV